MPDRLSGAIHSISTVSTLNILSSRETALLVLLVFNTPPNRAPVYALVDVCS